MGGNHKMKAIACKEEHYRPDFKTTMLLAGLYAKGKMTVLETWKSPDHLERALLWFGVPLESFGKFQNKIVLQNEEKLLKGKSVVIPADFSQAAPFLLLAAMLPGNEICLQQVNINPSRAGFLQILQRMGADIQIKNAGWNGYEPVKSEAKRS